MKNILIKINYDGTNFHGFQLQPDERTVEGELNLGVEKTVKHPVKIFYAGRTDRGFTLRDNMQIFIPTPQLTLEIFQRF